MPGAYDSFQSLPVIQHIARIAERIRATVAAPGEISRMGNDEFVCLVPGLDQPGAERVARELLRAIESAEIDLLHEKRADQLEQLNGRNEVIP
jgi:GGDEF domain-containing protein